MKPDLELVAALTEAILPRGVAVVAVDPTERPEAPMESEARAVADASPARQVEFLAGRAAAHRAMDALRMAQHPVPMGEDGAPIWPRDVLGCITHTEWASVAAVARARDWAGIGIHLQSSEPLSFDLLPQITTQAERAWLLTQPEEERGVLARLIFSAKTAASKAQYSVSRTLIEFQNFEVRIDRVASEFEAVFQTDKPPFCTGQTIAGKYLQAAGILVTAVTIGHSE